MGEVTLELVEDDERPQALLPLICYSCQGAQWDHCVPANQRRSDFKCDTCKKFERLNRQFDNEPYDDDEYYDDCQHEEPDIAIAYRSENGSAFYSEGSGLYALPGEELDRDEVQAHIDSLNSRDSGTWRPFIDERTLNEATSISVYCPDCGAEWEAPLRGEADVE